MRKKKIPQKIDENPAYSEIYDSNKKCKLTEWIPSVERNTVDIETNSWFDIKYHERADPILVETYQSVYPVISTDSYNEQMKVIKRTKSDKKPVFLFTEKIRLYPTEEQIEILDQWFDAFTKMFNCTIDYIRQKIFENGKLRDIKEVDKFLNFRSIRCKLLGQKKYIVESMPDHKIPSHVIDEATKQAVSNYKACVTNLMRGNIKKFRVRPWAANRNRKILKIEAMHFSGGTFCPRTFPSIKSSASLNGINRTSTLQYDKQNQKYILLVPRQMTQKTQDNYKISAGIDLGVRSFATVYSQNSTYDICNSQCHEKIQKIYRKIDKINEILQQHDHNQKIISELKDKDVKEVFQESGKNQLVWSQVKEGNQINQIWKKKTFNKQRLKRGLRKYHKKITDMVQDMHYKSSHELVNTFDNIYIGKLSTKKILARNNKVMSKDQKRILQTLSPYLFRERLTYMGYKYGCRVKEVSEYTTTKTCSNCGLLNEIGGAKIYDCKCGMRALRDENSAKTHLKLGLMNKFWVKYTPKKEPAKKTGLKNNTEEVVEI